MLKWGVMTALAATVFLAAGAVAQTTVPTKPVYHRTRAFDGIWSVSIFTINGNCPASLRYPARILDGRVMQAEPDPGYQMGGIVVSNGWITVIVAAGGQSAVASGRMTKLKGDGTWRTRDKQCSGTWTASPRTF